MTTPRDALRALEQKWRERDVMPTRNAILHEGNYQIRKQCADELAAIVSQMDSEPTVPEGSALDTEHEKSIYARCDDCGQLLPHCTCDEETTTSSEPTVAQWREAWDQYWEHQEEGRRERYDFDWIEQRARTLAAKDKP